MTHPRPDSDVSGPLAILAEIIGVDKAIELSVRFGGRRLHIPKEPPPTGELVDAIGEHAAQLLARRYGGTHFEIPLERGKRERIIAYSTQARPIPVREIARRVGCTERHVFKVRREFAASGGALPFGVDDTTAKARDKRQLEIFTPAAPIEPASPPSATDED